MNCFSQLNVEGIEMWSLSLLGRNLKSQCGLQDSFPLSRGDQAVLHIEAVPLSQLSEQEQQRGKPWPIQEEYSA
jgi:hypothetical protein